MRFMETDEAPQYPERAPDLYLQTCGELKKEIAESVKEGRQLERNALLACAAVYTYLASEKVATSPASDPLNALVSSDKAHGFPPIAWYVPSAIALFGAYRTVMLMISIRPRGQYLNQVERLIFDKTVLVGWETYFRSHYRFGVGASIWIFWIALISCTLIAPDYFRCGRPPLFAHLMWITITSEPIHILLIAGVAGSVAIATLLGTRQFRVRWKEWRKSFVFLIGVTAAVIVGAIYVLARAATQL